ncbi:MAG: T9SS type A sorting domain-containing protein [Saprospiraceae bacterium]|nr:T9SS type A sorting domain-containing protein [Saprospiraceae bacterium]
MKKFYTLIILAFIIFTTFDANATHLMGGTINYTTNVVAKDQFELNVILNVYRDPFSHGADFDNTIYFGIYKQIDNKWTFDTAISASINILPGEEIFFNPLICQFNNNTMYKANYKMNVILPQIDGDYMITHQRCCRIDSMTNIKLPYGIGMTFNIIIKKEGQKVNNMSPTIVENPKRLLITNEESEISFRHADLDNDDLNYSLAKPFQGGGPNSFNGNCNSIIPSPSYCLPPYEYVPYAENYNENYPFGLNSKTSYDKKNGTLSIVPNQEGVFLVSNEIREQRNGITLSITTFELNITVINPTKDTYGLEGIRFWDKNNNRILDNQETGVNIKIITDQEYCTFANYESGKYNYNLFIDSKYQIKSNNSLWKINLPNDQLEIYNNISGQNKIMDIPMVPVTLDAKVIADIFSARSRCNEQSRWTIHIHNDGTIPAKGKIKLILDYLLQVDSSDFNFQKNGQELTWEYEDLLPFESKDYTLILLMPNETHQGEKLFLDLSITSNGVANPELHYSTTLRCSFDPNEKTSYPSRGGENKTLPTEPIYYQINFQNIGNDYTEKVKIIDEISEHLDISSLEILKSSHSFTYQIIKNNTLLINFDNIHLNFKSQNDAESQGYVVYKINQKPHLPIKTSILNFAQIYFDNNPEYITNTTLNTVYPSLDIYPICSNLPYHLCLFPNPCSDFTYVSFNINSNEHLVNGKWILVNLLGEVINEGKCTAQNFVISTQNLATGTYILYISCNGNNMVDKIIKY